MQPQQRRRTRDKQNIANGRNHKYNTPHEGSKRIQYR